MNNVKKSVSLPLVMSCLLSACGGSSNSTTAVERSLETDQDLNLEFRALSFGENIDCEQALLGYGPDGGHRIGINDLRFFISNIKLFNEADEEIAAVLDENEFQYQDAAGSVALIDLTNNSEGSCATGTLASSEGTARTNSVIKGSVANETVSRISFDVGVPQSVMKSVIANHSLEDAPSPLGELHWSWANGYRHFVANFTVEDPAGEAGEGYVHIGSRGCGGTGPLALADKAQCDLINTPTVSLGGFVPSLNQVTVNIDALLQGLSMTRIIKSTEPPFDVLGEGPGVSCHSSGTQADCEVIFDNVGLDLETGTANSDANQVFGYQ